MRHVFQFTLPYDSDMPTLGLQSSDATGISQTVTGDLLLPIVLICFWHPRSAHAIMSVPEASVNENDLPKSRKDHIRPTREILPMEPIAVPHGVDQAAHYHLWFGVFTLDRAHGSAASLGILFHLRSSIFRLGSVSNSSTISLYRSTRSVTAVFRPSAANLASS